MPVIPYLGCMLMASAYYHLPPRILPVLHVIEGGKIGMIKPDTNGTRDYGYMQVNSVWLPVLATRSRLSPDIVAKRLTDDACFNIAAAAVIMRTDIDRANGNIMQAVGDYHSASPSLGDAYRQRAIATARMMFGK